MNRILEDIVKAVDDPKLDQKDIPDLANAIQ
jgi:hypothetical protein